MKWDVKLYVAGKVFVESVHARNHNDAIETAKAAGKTKPRVLCHLYSCCYN